jgi:cell filamentation protein
MREAVPPKSGRFIGRDRFVLDRESFARISAVEGVALTAETREVLDQFDRAGLSAVARRRAIHERFASSADSRSLHDDVSTGAMEDSGSDPYRYPGSSVLKNRLGLRDQAELDAFEALITAQRGEEPLPRGVLSFAHYRAIHHHLFQDVFEWAGKCRTVHIAKGGNMFCSPECIEGKAWKLFIKARAGRFLRNQPAREFARLSAEFLAELNAIHPFRDGNGRALLTYLTLLAARAGRPLALERMEPMAMLAAIAASYNGDKAPLAALIEGLIER